MHNKYVNAHVYNCRLATVMKAKCASLSQLSELLMLGFLSFHHFFWWVLSDVCSHGHMTDSCYFGFWVVST